VRIAIVGAGWAGIGAAIRLVATGHRVTLVDAAPGAGGRARGIAAPWHGGGDGQALDLDNGQHLVIGAYTELLSLLELIGVDPLTVFERSRFRLDDRIGLRIPGPGLAGLLRARGLSWRVRVAVAGLLARIRRDRDAALSLAEGRTVTEWCELTRQPAQLVERLWRPLVVSALNTPVTDACAATFVNVLADSLCGPPGVTDFLVPRTTLSAAFVDPAIAWLRRAGAMTVFGADVRRIVRVADGYRLLSAGGEPVRSDSLPGSVPGAERPIVEADGIVIATPPGIAGRILARSTASTIVDAVADAQAIAPEAALLPLVRSLGDFRHRPITTVYVGWPDRAGPAAAEAWSRLPVVTLLHDRPDDQRFGQWLFRRPSQRGWRVGAVVISDSAAAAAIPRDALVTAVARQLGAHLGLEPPQAHAIYHDRRATIDCVPDRPRIATMVADAGRIALAGDYQYARYPATLEAALRSGRDAAAQIASIA
jgi:squalene-associated FAD-dependent desaturase